MIFFDLKNLLKKWAWSSPTPTISTVFNIQNTRALSAVLSIVSRIRSSRRRW